IAALGEARRSRMLFTIGDYLAGSILGIVTALVVRAITWPGMDMVIAMLVGMAAGMVLHLVVGLVLSPCLGMFETMMPASLIGMYGGMFFGMRESMACGSATRGAAAGGGAIFCLVVVLRVEVYEAILRGTVLYVGGWEEGA